MHISVKCCMQSRGITLFSAHPIELASACTHIIDVTLIHTHANRASEL